MQEKYFNKLVERLCQLPTCKVVDAYNNLCDMEYMHLMAHKTKDIKHYIDFVKNVDDTSAFNPNDRYFMVTENNELASFNKVSHAFAENLALSMVADNETYGLQNKTIVKMVSQLYESGYRG